MNKSQKYSVAVMGGRVAGANGSVGGRVAGANDSVGGRVTGANGSVGGGYLIAYVSIVG